MCVESRVEKLHRHLFSPFLILPLDHCRTPQTTTTRWKSVSTVVRRENSSLAFAASNAVSLRVAARGASTRRPVNVAGENATSDIFIPFQMYLWFGFSKLLEVCSFLSQCSLDLSFVFLSFFMSETKVLGSRLFQMCTTL